jgi:hypothetical protein
MTVYSSPDAYRLTTLGNGPVSKATGTLSAATIPVFTVTGGEVMITGLWLKVTTSITGIGTVALQNDPTTGDTFTLVVATDLGSTDTVVGSVVGLAQTTAVAPSFLRGGNVALNAVVTTGTVDIVGALAINGAVTVYATWVPLVDGAVLAAA